jgi:hypothetical protein
MARSIWLSLALVLVPAAAQAQTVPDPAPAAAAPSVIAPAATAPYVAPQQPPQVTYYYPQPYAYPYPQQQQPQPVKAPLSPRRIPYHGGEIPAGATVITKGHNGLLAAGLSVFGGLYVISVITAAASCSPGDSASTCRSNTAWLYIPAIGPFLTAADQNASFGGRNLAIFDGVFQLAGLAAAVGAYASSEQWLEYSGPTARAHAPGPRWALLPGAVGANAGATLQITAF